MANDGKFMNLTNGQPTLENAVDTSAGAGDANKIPKLNAQGKIDATMLDTAPESQTIIASEVLSAGNLIHVHNNGGTRNMRKADATTAGKQAVGFVNAAVANGVGGVANLEEGPISGLSGLTPGTVYYLSTTPGAITAVAPSAASNVVQEVGYALSATELMFRPRQPILLA